MEGLCMVLLMEEKGDDFDRGELRKRLCKKNIFDSK